MRGVDPARIALWGSSYSGGHVVAVAAKDRSVAAVISQGAAMDGLAALLFVRKAAGMGKLATLTAAGLGDLLRAAMRREPALVPVVGEPGSDAVISAPGSVAGYQAIMGPTFRNEMLGRGILRLALNRPVRSAGKLTCPILLIVADNDNIAPAAAVHRVARKAPHSEVEAFACGHFDIYLGEVFEKSVARQVEFLSRHLG
jgi:pimeloyl-ACP methyl ester carboxylesterase